jgi:hypothetical protein
MAALFLNNSNKVYILHHSNIMFVRSARNGPPTPAPSTRTGRHTCLALLALLASLSHGSAESYREEPRTQEQIGQKY